MPFSDRASSLLRFFGPGYLCPFAAASMRSDSLLTAELTPDATTTMANLRKVLPVFIDQRTRLPNCSLVLVYPDDALSEVAFVPRVRRLFTLLYFLLQLHQDPRQAPELAAADAQRAAEDTFNPARPVRTYLAVDGAPLASVAFGSFYPVLHTRFAPHDCMVLNWFEDVARAPVAARDRIRAAIVARMGELYDADDPAVPAAALRR